MGASKFNFKISDYTVAGNKKIGNQIYGKLSYLSQASEDNPETKNIYLSINSSKNKQATTTDSKGKILAYKIYLSTSILEKWPPMHKS